MNTDPVILATAFVLPSLAAWLALEYWWPGKASDQGERLFKLSLCAPLAAGFGSVFFFVWAIIFTPAGITMVYVEIAVLFAALFFLVPQLIIRRQAEVAGNRAVASPQTQLRLRFSTRVLSVLACATSGSLALVALASRLIQNPHGGWDAWAIWNLRARFLFRSGPFWTDSFSPDLFWSSPDYPLGLPGYVALIWKYVDNDTVIVPMLVAAMFFVATGGLLYASLRRFNGQIAATFGLIALAGTSFFISHSASQYADVPLGFFVLATVVLMASYDNNPIKRPGWLFLAGIAGSLAAWTKNEGVLFLIALVLARVVLAALARDKRHLKRECVGLLSGAAPTLVVLLVFKIFFAPSNGFLTAQGWGDIWQKLTDWSRYQEIATAFFKEMSMYGDGMIILVIVVAIIAGINWRGFKETRWLSGMIVVTITLMSYFFIYVITPSRLSWHLGTSLSRVLLQLWPTTLFLIFLNLRKVGDSYSRQPAGETAQP